MKIGELSRRSGVAASTVRYYEAQRLLEPASRRGGQRIYDESALRRLEVISVAKDAGFTLEEIRHLMHQFKGARWRSLAERKLQEVTAAENRLRVMKRLLVALSACGCFDIDECGRVLRGSRQREGR